MVRSSESSRGECSRSGVREGDSRSIVPARITIVRLVDAYRRIFGVVGHRDRGDTKPLLQNHEVLSQADTMVVKIVPNDKGNPVGLTPRSAEAAPA